MSKTDFDLFLEEQLKDPDFAERLETTQQQISRLESPAYEGHSLSMLRRVAAALDARVHVVIEPLPKLTKSAVVREEGGSYGSRKKRK